MKLTPAEIATATLRELGVLKLPVDVQCVAQLLGVTIYKRPINVSGILLRDQGGEWIVVRARDSAKRQRFTIAHEIGHSRCRHQGLRFMCDSNFRTDSTIEREANQFAAELLMPRAAFSALYNRGKREKDLASYFGVSVEAATWRAVDLGFKSRQEAMQLYFFDSPIERMFAI
jgi:Zn-dependent peptidase ImmA (M78 family)